MPKISEQERADRIRVAEACVELTKAVIAIEEKYQLSVDELAQLLVDRASRILDDGIAIERGRDKRDKRRM